MNSFSFQLHKTNPNTNARRGSFSTSHGTVQTPIFMPVGTMASVKTLHQQDLKELGAQIILGNTYHLMLRPGTEVFNKFGGLHQFMKWDKPILTDSGGFQIFCLENHREITDEGAKFRSYLNGDLFWLTPEKSIEVQETINSDIMMVLDQCIPSTSDHSTTKAAMDRTHAWAMRSFNARTKKQNALFAIVQGGIFEDLRNESAQFLTQHPFDGFAIGGLAVGEEKHEREDFTELVAQQLPKDKPRYLMGVGTPLDLLEAVHRGVDMFDCIIPTMYAQRGTTYTSRGKQSLVPKALQFLDEPLDPLCNCFTCKNYSIGYLHHIVKCVEPTAWRLLTIHNIHFYLSLMEEIRTSIEEDRFYDFYLSKKSIWEIK